jgi:hypothetical protein
MDKHRFKLLTGFEMQVKPLTGYHQEILTKNSHLTFPEKVSLVLADVTDYVGATSKPDEAFFNRMLSADRKKALLELRSFSNDFNPEFEFTYDFKNPKNGQKQTVEFTRNLTHTDVEGNVINGLPEKPYKNLHFDAMDSYELLTKRLSSNVSCLKEVEVELPKLGNTVRYTLLDGYGEILAAKTKKTEASAGTLLSMRFLKEKHELDNSVQWIDSRHHNYSPSDLALVRKSIKECEGIIDSETIIENPFIEGEEVVVDILNTISFFFPGGVV